MVTATLNHFPEKEKHLQTDSKRPIPKQKGFDLQTQRLMARQKH